MKCIGKKDGGREVVGIVRKYIEVCFLRILSIFFKKLKEGVRNVV